MFLHVLHVQVLAVFQGLGQRCIYSIEGISDHTPQHANSQEAREGVSGGVVQGRGQYVCDLDPLQLALVVLIINRHTRGLDGMREHVHDQII